MDDTRTTEAVAPFWRCPDCGSKGTPYVAELDAARAKIGLLDIVHAEMKARIAELEADRNRQSATLARISGLLLDAGETIGHDGDGYPEAVARIVAERDRLRAALEAAPEPTVVSSGRGPYSTNSYADSPYADWHATTRAEALRHE